MRRTIITAALLGLAACKYPYPGDYLADGSTDGGATTVDAMPDAPVAARTIAFTSDRTGNFDIFTMRVDGTMLKNLTNHPSLDTSPVWSPAGDRIAFESNRTGTNEVFVVDADGGSLLDVSMGSGIDPAWSPDGSQLAFVSNRTGSYQLYRTKLDGSAPTPLTTTGGLEPDWSPDGARIVYSSANRIVVMNADGTNPVPLTTGIDSHPRWRPDHGAIAYVHRVSFTNLEIYVMGPDGSNQTDLTNSAATSDLDPQWSRNAQQIAMQGGTDANTEIQVVNADGTGLRNLSMTPVSDSLPRWAPDGVGLSFTSGDDVYVFSTLDEPAINITHHAGSSSFAAWRPTP